jgi:hypothetical protein
MTPGHQTGETFFRKGDWFMKKRRWLILLLVLIGMAAGTAWAVDLAALDRVSILMPKSKVLSILGPPDEVGDIGHKLKADIYKLTDAMAPMIGAGCVYDEQQILAATAFIFEGAVGKETADRIKEAGFTYIGEKDGAARLAGKDDDTGLPVVVTVVENGGLTTVITFEKGFYDRNVK